MIVPNICSRFALIVAMLSVPGLQAGEALQLRYTHPAERWTEALPVGNGRLGAMVFGGVTNEHLQTQGLLWGQKTHPRWFWKGIVAKLYLFLAFFGRPQFPSNATPG
jgi:hypothetical protein